MLQKTKKKTKKTKYTYTGVWAAADAVRILMKTSTQLSRCSQEDKPQSQMKFHVRREDPSIVNFADYSQSSASQVLQEKTRPTAD